MRKLFLLGDSIRLGYESLVREKLSGAEKYRDATHFTAEGYTIPADAVVKACGF